MAAVVGGTIARLGGGKFANGAVSAAFVHLFNNELAIRRHTTPLGGDPKKDPEIASVISEGAKVRYTQCGGERNSCGVSWAVSGVLTADEAKIINSLTSDGATHVSTAAGIVAGTLTARTKAPLSVSLFVGAITNEAAGAWTNSSIVPVVEGDVLVHFLVQQGMGDSARFYSFDTVVVRQKRN
jgi:hypothetical protein